MKIKPRCFILTAIFLALSFPVQAQPLKKIFRVGWLSPRLGIEVREEIFRQSLRELGYVEGQNIIIEWKFAEDKPERLAALAQELVNLNVDVIVTSSTPAIRAAKNATKTIPIVMANVGDPVAAGFVASFARPGANLTGFTNLSPALGGKRLELLKEAVPRLFRVAVIWNPDANAPALKELDTAARAMGVQLRPTDVREPKDFEIAFDAASKARVDGLITLPSSLLVSHRTRLTALASKRRIPAIYPQREIAEAGGLMAYGPDTNDNFRRAAVYVDKILNGSKPGDLPVEQPTKFELVINLKAAKQIGLKIPPNMLVRADKVIR